MRITALGLVLNAMAKYAQERVLNRQHALGKQNCELLWAISHMLHVGAEKCSEIAEQELNEGGD